MYGLPPGNKGLLKTEFDQYRAQGVPHPLITEAGIDAVPHRHPKLDDWRNNFRGARTVHEKSNFAFAGRLEFTIRLLPYDGDDGWVEETIAAIRQTLSAAAPPPNSDGCEYCMFAQKASRAGEE